MEVHIKKVDDGFILVNDKIIIKDINGQWITAVELTVFETEALQKFITNGK